MTGQQIHSLATKYVDESIATGGGSPSAEEYDAAVARVEAETRKLLAASEAVHDREPVAC